MFAKRPRFDDTFGVRMDLGADRMDPLSLRPASLGGQLRVKPPVLVEQPWSIFDIFSRRETDPYAALRGTPANVSSAPDKPEPPRPRPGASSAGNAPAPNPAASGLRAFWQRLSWPHRIAISVFAGWFLLSTGLFIPAIVIAVAYFSLRKRAA
ncbi:MAG: hypothetical protein RLO80_10040 [Hyphomonas sp.]